ALPDGPGGRRRPLHAAMLDQRVGPRPGGDGRDACVRRTQPGDGQAGAGQEPRPRPARDHVDSRHVRRQRQVAVPHRPSDQERSRRRPRRGRARQVRNRHLRAAIGRGRQQRPRPARDHRHRPGAQRQPLRPVRLSVTMRGPALFAAAAALALWAAPGAAAPPPPGWLFNDSHFHLTNYVQRGLTMRQYVAMMGTTVKRSTVFGIPLQQTWSYPNSGDYAPTYYLQPDASLYYYSFTDAMIATGYLSLPPEDRARLDPMITGFNPADMY